MLSSKLEGGYAVFNIIIDSNIWNLYFKDMFFC